jgi:hypothetical protein
MLSEFIAEFEVADGLFECAPLLLKRLFWSSVSPRLFCLFIELLAELLLVFFKFLAPLNPSFLLMLDEDYNSEEFCEYE